MIIGKDFNSKAKEVLKLMFENSEGKHGKRVEVTFICETLNIDKTEAKNLFEYLESKDCITIETLGGPYLYGDVSLTKKGVAKSKK
jgi:predicted transcriptional regulator